MPVRPSIRYSIALPPKYWIRRITEFQLNSDNGGSMIQHQEHARDGVFWNYMPSLRMRFRMIYSALI